MSEKTRRTKPHASYSVYAHGFILHARRIFLIDITYTCRYSNVKYTWYCVVLRPLPKASLFAVAYGFEAASDGGSKKRLPTGEFLDDLSSAIISIYSAVISRCIVFLRSGRYCLCF